MTTKRLKSNVGRNAPLWMQHTTAILAILMASKGMLIDNMPGLADAAKTLAGQWFDYIANLFTVAFAIITIFSAKKDKNINPYV